MRASPQPSVTKDCLRCQRPFTVAASMAKRKHCTQECYYAYRRSLAGVEERFWRQVNKTPTCWLWNGWKLNSGYGETFWKPKKILAHRLSYIIAHGGIPAGKHILHKCDVPLCVRPDHLYLGTDIENHRDMVERGRTTAGERHFRARLTDEQAREIRERHVYVHRRKTNQRELATEYGVSVATINHIVRGRTWKRV